MDNLVEIKNLTKVFDPEVLPALNNITASIPRGEIVGVVGPDGAGKTTLIRLMAALLTPTRGEITVDGRSTVAESEYIHHITGYMPQKFGLYEDLTVMQNLTLYADLQGVTGTLRTQTFEKLLAFTDLAPFTTRLAGNLSGGMKQKLGLACALVRTPTLLLMDEPSVGVDPLSRRELWKMVNDLLNEGISIVWSTAYLDEAEKCTTVLLLNQGELLYHGKPKELTQIVEHRTFKITDIKTQKRHVLTQIRQEKSVVDAIIQGKDIRVVLKKGSPFPLPELNPLPVPPRFEDAFIDILGGSPQEPPAPHLVPTKAGSDTPIIARNLTKKFGNFTAADHIDCTVHRQEIFGLLGPNGAGKSTTFKMLCGLLRPTAGTAEVMGLDLIHSPSAARAKIGYMAQKFSLYGNLTVLQNLTFFSGIYGLTGDAQSEAIARVTALFHLHPYLTTDAEMLPLGYKQRLSLACAIMHEPEVLFLDEPTSGVDPVTRREFWNHIHTLVEKGVTIMVTTHFMEEAEVCDRIALIYRGHIITTDTPDALKQKAASQATPNPTLEEAFIHHIEAYDATVA